MVDIKELVKKTLIEENKERTANHTPSGKLSASILTWPVQWQILKWLGVEQGYHSVEKLGTFRRGVILEDELYRMVKSAGCEVETQKLVEYRNTVGYVDLLIDGEIVEVKSTEQKYFKRLKHAKRGHILQACLYALAMKKDDFSVTYIEPNKLLIKQFNYKTSEWKKHVDFCIDSFEKWQKVYEETQMVPPFIARERINSFPGQNPFPKYAGFTKSFKFTNI